MRDLDRCFIAAVFLLAACLAGCAGENGQAPQSASPGSKALEASPGPEVPVAGGASTSPAPAVRGWSETVVIPTYPVGPASEFPDFVRTAGSYRRPRDLYPYTAQRELSFQRRDEGYLAYLAENEYLRIEVLPTIGGRLFALYDRVTGQDILYRQVSIKPALVGLRGAWISGGIEWNFPRGHSVTTHDTVSCRLVRRGDGSVSIVVGDTERTFRMSWTVELRLRPGRAFVETRIICRNPTPFPHEAGWWSNACFPANEQTQIIFPFHKVTGHGAEGLDDWPVRDGQDMSWYKQYRSASSVFRAAGEEDFMAAYDHGRDVGLAQYADRKVMPGRKWWTWGTDEAGMRWAGTLSDDDRPYVEIQSGYPLTQGQEFTMQPYEEREFLEYWMPVTRIGPPARINPEAVVRLTVQDGVATVGVLPTGRIERARLELRSIQDSPAGDSPQGGGSSAGASGRLLKQWNQTISPAEPLKDACPLEGADPNGLCLSVFDAAGREVISHRYNHYARGETLIQPDRNENNQERPRGEETPADRLENAIELLGGGQFAKAREVLEGLQAAPDRGMETSRPAAGQQVDRDAVRYYLGLAAARLGQAQEAMKHWSALPPGSDVGDAGAIEGAKLLMAEGKWRQAMERLRPLTGRAPAHALAQAYTALALRQLGRTEQAHDLLTRALGRDPLLLLAQVELAVLDGRPFDGLSALRDEQRRIEAATRYIELGLYDLAGRLLLPAAGSANSATAAYLRAYVAELAGRDEHSRAEASGLREQAQRASVRGCMPSRLEELAALEAALRADPKDASAHYLVGLALFDKGRREEAIEHWRQAGRLGHGDAMVYRCLGGVVREANPAEAVAYFQRAVELAPDAPEIYADLEEAYREMGETAKRLAVLEQAAARLPNRDDLAHRLALAYFDAGRYDDAVKCYLGRKFHVAEGEYGLHDDYVMALVGRATTRLAAGRKNEALADLDAALEYPENLGIGRPGRSSSDATVQFWRGIALGSLGRDADAKKAWSEAASLGRISRRLSPWSPQRGLHAVCAILARRRLRQDQQAEALAKQLDEAAQRVQEYRPPHGKAFVTLLRAFQAAGEANTQQAEEMLARAEADSDRIAGYVRLVRAWVPLLARSPAGAGKVEPTTPAR